MRTMKYALDALIYLVVISMLIGIVGAIMGYSFFEYIYPTGDDAVFRWLLRGLFVIYFTIFRPIPWK